MIHVDRSQVAIPRVLLSADVKKELKRAGEFFDRPTQARAQQQYEFRQDLYRHYEVVKALNELFHGKCAYCETPMGFSAEVEHFRPMKSAMALDGKVHADHYWWLAYEWTNLYPVCQPCNRMKATRFPIRGKTRAPSRSSAAELAEERPLLLDPCADHPEEHLVFASDGAVASSTEEGKLTIEVLGLNRQGMIIERQKSYQDLHDLYLFQIKRLGQKGIARDQGFRQQLRDGLNAERPYAALQRQFIKKWLHEAGITDLSSLMGQATEEATVISSQLQHEAASEFAAHSSRQVSYSVEKRAAEQQKIYYTGAKRIERIEIKNFKAIRHLELKFTQPRSERESWMMLIGENGTGKSSILQAVGLALMGEQHCNELGLNASQFVRGKGRGAKGFVKVHLTNIPEPIVLNFRRGSRAFSVEPKDPKVLLLGYGATRLLPRQTKERISKEKYVRVKNLFVPTAPLNDAEAWLSNRKKVPQRRFSEVAKTLKDLLMLDDNASFSRDRGAVKVRMIDGPVTLHDLSDGFQSVVAMCADIMISLLEKWEDMKIAEGVVLLDEIEVHLHPSWKIEIVERLRRCFPRVTFLVTTHDPLCLKGLSKEEIVVLRRDVNKNVVATNEIPETEDLRADQILTSPLLFGLRSTVGKLPEPVRKYTDLMKKRKKTAQDIDEIERLRSQLEDLFSSAENPLEKQVEQAVRQTLRGSPASPPAELRRDQAENFKLELDQAPPELRLAIKRQLRALFKK